MAKKVIGDVDFFDESGDIIDRITREIDNELKLDLSGIEETNVTDKSIKDDYGRSFDLSAVMEYYHKKLFENKEALSWLAGRGFKSNSLSSPEILGRFKLGFADGSLVHIIGAGQTVELKKCGIIRENGIEHFERCIVFPVFDDNGNTIGFYGISIETGKDVYAGKHQGIFNRKASKVYDEIILTGSIIEALSLIELGFENVLVCYGDGDPVETFKTDRVKTIIMSFKDDELKNKLVNEGLAVKSISFSVGMNKDEIQNLIDKAETFRTEKSNDKFKVSYDNGVYIFFIDGMIYNLAGIKDIFSPNLKVKIRVELQDKYHRDYLDLYPYRARQNFSNVASGRLDVNSARIEKDLDKILDYFEEERDKRLATGIERKDQELTEEEIKTGMEFLKSSDLIDRTIEDITTVGYAGEDNNKLLVYVIGISRNLPKPLSLFALSSPGSGKSYLVDIVLKLFPLECLKYNSSLSDQAFHYMPESDFDGNIFVMGESLHNPLIEGYIRQMQTENMLSRSVVKKDESTGEMKTVSITHKVRLVFMTTSTHPDPNIENISRCILLKIDESSDQTDRVHKRQRYKRTHEGILADRHLIPDIVRKHIISQRLLKPVMIYNPFAEYIDFPKHKSILRRSQEHFLITIESICYWRQYQKRVVKKFNPYLSIDEDFIECDFYDYELARKLFIECKLLSGIEEIPEAMVFLYDRIREMLRKRSKKDNLTTEEVIFSQGDVREIENLQMGNDSIKRYIRMMVDYEFLLIAGTKRNGIKNNYRLKQDLPIKKINIAEIIPTVEQIKEMMKSK